MSARSALHFSVEVLPRELASPKVPGSLTGHREAVVVATAVSDSPTVRGWILPSEEIEIRGLRATNSRQTAVARRKQTRLDVYVQHPQHPNSLQCGFIIEPQLRTGWNEFELQYKDQYRRWHTFCRLHLKLPRLWRLRSPKSIAMPTDHEYWSRQHGDAQAGELQAMAVFLQRFPAKPPLLSVLMPTYNTPKRWLQRAIESIQQQVYPHWELCIADDLSDDAAVLRLLRSYTVKDSRIKVKFLSERGHICRSSNAALELCRGDYTVLLDHDDELPPHALFHIAHEVAYHPDTDIVFSDEDKIDLDGFRSDPYFKPGWNYDLLLSENCVSHLGAFRTSLLRDIGGFQVGYEGSQDWDMTLRAFERSSHSRMRHIPRILYHWRTLATSTASGSQAKPYARLAGQRAVSDHLQRTCPGAKLQPLSKGQWRILWPMPKSRPLISIIIFPSHLTALAVSQLERLLASSTYTPIELIFISPDDDADLLELVKGHAGVHYLPAAKDLNVVAQLNLAVSAAKGEVLIFQQGLLNGSSEDWLDELVRQASRPDVGAVAASVVFHSNLLHCSGLALHPRKPVMHFTHRHLPLNARTVGGPSDAVREVSAVPDACFAVRREVLIAAGGFDPAFTSTLAATTDLCFRMATHGLRHVVTPFSLLHHPSDSHESMIPDLLLPDQDALLLADRWPANIAHDRFFNANLSAISTIPIASVPSIKWPWDL